MEWLALNNLIFLSTIPVIILFYLLKRKYNDHEISSILLWQKMLRNIEANRPWQKLQKNLLLILQLLVALLLVIALLRPALPANGLIANHTIIVIDNSGSMLTKEQNLTRLQLAKNKAKQIIETLSNNQYITLIEMAELPKILVTKSSDKAVLAKEVDAIKPSFNSANHTAAFSLAKSIAGSDNQSGIIWLSDGAKNDLQSSNEFLPEEIPFKHYQIGKATENLSIATFVTQQINGSIEGLIRIDNNGIQTKSANVVIYDHRDNLIDSINFEIAGNDSNTIELASLPESIAYKAILTGDSDGIDEDNQVWSIPFTTGVVEAALISETGNHFLTQALKINNKLNLTLMNTLPEKYDDKIDLWIFDRIVPEQLPETNVFLIAPDNSTSWFNFNGEISPNSNLNIRKPQHELLKHINWDEIHISKIKSFNNLKGIEPLVKSDTNTIVAAGMLENRRLAILGFDIQQSDFPLRSGFPIFIHNVTEWLAPDKLLPIDTAFAGEKITIPTTAGATERIVTTPGGEKEILTSPGTFIIYQVPQEIGLYELEEKVENNQIKRYFSVQMKEAEAIIRPELISINTVNTSEEEGEVKSNTSSVGFKELAGWFILAGLLFSFIEWVVYKRGY